MIDWRVQAERPRPSHFLAALSCRLQVRHENSGNEKAASRLRPRNKSCAASVRIVGRSIADAAHEMRHARRRISGPHELTPPPAANPLRQRFAHLLDILADQLGDQCRDVLARYNALQTGKCRLKVARGLARL